MLHSLQTVRMRCLLALWTLVLSGCSSVPILPPLVPPPPPVPPTSATVGNTTLVAIAAPAPAKCGCTLPEFLGINQLILGTAGLLRILRNRITARLGGAFPGLEPKPPILAITDPANLDPSAPPSVQAAARVKQQEDAGAQKAKAAAYLATVGCGCYEGVAEALAENLTDCSEVVRYATVDALRAVAKNGCCTCGGNSCCTLEVHQGLQRLAWEVGTDGCFVEPSLRVRRIARLALQNCCAPPPTFEVDDPLPIEGPGPDEEILSKTEVSSPEQIAATVLATVNDETILAETILSEVEDRFIAQGTAIEVATDAELTRLMEEVLEEVIDRKILAQTAMLVLSDSVIEQLRQQSVFASESPIGQVAYDESESDGRFDALLADELLRRQLDDDSNISDDQIEQHYRDRAADYRKPNQFRWKRVSISQTSIPDETQRLAMLTHAQRHAEGFPTEPPPGYHRDTVETQTFEWTTLDQILFPPIRGALSKLQPGQSSEIVNTAVDSSFLVVDEIRLGAVQPLSEVRDLVRSDLIEQHRRKKRDRYVHRLRSNADIRITGPTEPTPRP